MQTNSFPTKNYAADEISTLGEKITDTASQLKEKVADLGRSAANMIDDNRGATAGGLQTAATAIHDRAGSLPGGETVSGIAHDAAEKLSSTADYVRANDVKKMMADVETMVKNNPGPSLMVAAVIGFLVGRAFTSND